MGGRGGGGGSSRTSCSEDAAAAEDEATTLSGICSSKRNANKDRHKHVIVGGGGGGCRLRPPSSIVTVIPFKRVNTTYMTDSSKATLALVCTLGAALIRGNALVPGSQKDKKDGGETSTAHNRLYAITLPTFSRRRALFLSASL